MELLFYFVWNWREEWGVNEIVLAQWQSPRDRAYFFSLLPFISSDSMVTTLHPYTPVLIAFITSLVNLIFSPECMQRQRQPAELLPPNDVVPPWLTHCSSTLLISYLIYLTAEAFNSQSTDIGFLSRTSRKRHRAEPPCRFGALCGSLCPLRAGKYMQMMNILKPIAFDVIHCVSQLFDYYLYAVYTFFGRNDMVQYRRSAVLFVSILYIYIKDQWAKTEKQNTLGAKMTETDS